MLPESPGIRASQRNRPSKYMVSAGDNANIELCRLTSRRPSTVVEFPEDIDALKAYGTTEEHDVVLSVVRPRRESHTELSTCTKQSVSFHLNTTSLIAECKCRVEAALALDPTTEPTTSGISDARDRMSLFRALMRGVGFYTWMVQKPGQQRELPEVNFLESADVRYVEVLLQEAHEGGDRLRLYLSVRPLGIGLITGVSATSVSIVLMN